MIQGYYYAKPMPADDYVARMEGGVKAEAETVAEAVAEAVVEPAAQPVAAPAVQPVDTPTAEPSAAPAAAPAFAEAPVTESAPGVTVPDETTAPAKELPQDEENKD